MNYDGRTPAAITLSPSPGTPGTSGPSSGPAHKCCLRKATYDADRSGRAETYVEMTRAEHRAVRRTGWLLSQRPVGHSTDYRRGYCSGYMTGLRAAW